MRSKITNTRFSELNYKRSSGGVSFEERAPQPSDFTYERGYSYADDFAESGDTGAFELEYPNWQAFADCFVMRRAVITISGKQQCTSDQFLAGEIENYTYPDFVPVKNFAAAGVRSADTIPEGDYLNTEMEFTEAGNGYVIINVSYVQYREWKLVKVITDTPNPAGDQ